MLELKTENKAYYSRKRHPFLLLNKYKWATPPKIKLIMNLFLNFEMRPKIRLEEETYMN